MSRGFIYYSVGSNSTNKAKRSIDSLLQYMPKASVTIFTDRPSLFQEINISTVTVSPEYNKAFRISLLLKTPYTRTFYIDSDTYFQASCEDAFNLLDESPLLLAYADIVWQQASPKEEEFPFFNSGVIGYRLTSEITDLFTNWSLDMEKAIKLNKIAKDEPVLRRLLFSKKTPIQVLASVYNYRLTKSTLVPNAEKGIILHGELDTKVK